MSNFKYYRAKTGMSQKEVGDYLGITSQAYSNYENGKREADYETLLKLSELFNTSIENLLIDEEPSELKKSPAEAEDDEIMEYLEELKNNPGMRILFSKTKGATMEDIEKVVRMIEIMKGDSFG